MRERAEWAEVVAAIHCHSLYSDGRRSLGEIVAEAQAARLDALLTTDHNTLQPLHDGWEGWHGDLLLLVGEEITPGHGTEAPGDARNNHYLAFGIREAVQPRAPKQQATIDAVAAQRGLGFIAHPDEPNPFPGGLRGFPWTDWSARGFTGLEIWTLLSDQVETRVGLNRLRSLVDRRRALSRPRSATLARWDRLAAERRIVGIGSVDAHGWSERLGLLSITPFGYRWSFTMLRSHLFTDRPIAGASAESARAAVYRALRRARCFVARDGLGSSAGFRFTAEAGDRSWTIGDAILENDPVTFRVTSPRLARLRLLRDGRVVADSRTHSHALVYRSGEPGAYRAEAYLRGRAWVFTNHITITADGRMAEEDDDSTAV